MKPAAAARVTALTLLQGFKRNNQNVAKWKKKKGKLRESSLHIQGDFLKKLIILAQKQKTKKKTTVGNGDKIS